MAAVPEPGGGPRSGVVIVVVIVVAIAALAGGIVIGVLVSDDDPDTRAAQTTTTPTATTASDTTSSTEVAVIDATYAVTVSGVAAALVGLPKGDSPETTASAQAQNALATQLSTQLERVVTNATQNQKTLTAQRKAKEAKQWADLAAWATGVKTELDAAAGKTGREAAQLTKLLGDLQKQGEALSGVTDDFESASTHAEAMTALQAIAAEIEKLLSGQETETTTTEPPALTTPEPATTTPEPSPSPSPTPPPPATTAPPITVPGEVPDGG
jgi:hypothetical protein